MKSMGCVMWISWCLMALALQADEPQEKNGVESVCPDLAAVTELALLMIGADEMASFVKDALRPMESTNSINSKDAWVEHYLSLPDHVH